MGYYSTVQGELICKPGLDLDKVYPRFGETGDADLEGKFENNETVDVLPDGTIGVVGNSQTFFGLRIEDEYRADELADTVEELCRLCKKEGVKLNGTLFVTGEDPLDLWRCHVVDNVLKVELPVLTWPDGSTMKCGR